MSILKEGYPFIFPSFAAALPVVIVPVFLPITPITIACFVLGSLLIIFALFCMFFFRDPKITITQGDGIILSPCNGTVMEIVEDAEASSDAEASEDTSGDEKVIRVFLSTFSVHLQRSPVSGTVVSVEHKNGKFLAAWDPRAHIENEQNIFTIQSDDTSGKDGIYTVRQIAGLVARRCVSWVKAGDVLKAGDKIGMIKFSSQIDIHLPKSMKINVKNGDKIRAGITVIATK